MSFFLFFIVFFIYLGKSIIMNVVSVLQKGSVLVEESYSSQGNSDWWWIADGLLKSRVKISL